MSVALVGLGLGYYSLYRVPEESASTSSKGSDVSSARGEAAARAAAAGIGAIAPGTFGQQATSTGPGVSTSDLDAEVLRNTTGKHWRQQREDVKNDAS